MNIGKNAQTGAGFRSTIKNMADVIIQFKPYERINWTNRTSVLNGNVQSHSLNDKRNMLVTNKIKATAEGRQRTCIKLERIANNATFTAGGQCDLCGGHTFNTSDHMSRKTGYTRRIPYKTGIGIATPLKQKATHDAPASFLLSVHTHTLSMVGCMGLTSVRLVSFCASCSNSVQSTASEFATSGGGYIPTQKEAAKWLLSLPSHILRTPLSGALSSLIRVIPASFTSWRQPSRKRVTVARPVVLPYSLPVFVRG